MKGGKRIRETLFRGKRVDNGEWIEGYFFKSWDKVFLLWGMTGDCPNMEEVVPETVGQFTGLCDKNGKKIFEGDIVKVTIGVKGYRTTYNSVNCTVEFRSDNCGIAVFYPFTNSNIIESEVIGNKYDNKEEE